MTDFKNILLDLGYSNIKDNGKELRMRPLYRDSGNDTVLSVRKDTGHFIDFSKSISGSFEYLIQLSLNLKSLEDARKALSDRWSVSEIKREHRPSVNSRKVFPKEYLTKLMPDHSYWIERGVRLETIKLFAGGVVTTGTMSGRYVFPILDSKGYLVGVTGRITKPEAIGAPKWLHKGRTSEWKYPLQVNHDIIREEKRVFLVESIGDMLSLWDAGIRSTLIVFGLNLSPSMISLLIKLDPNYIYICLNNDSENEAGNKASLKINKKLQGHFDPHQVKIALPDKNDFGEMSEIEIKEWYVNKVN